MTPTDTPTLPQRHARPFIGEEVKLTEWTDVQPFFDNLKDRKIDNVADLRQWFLDRSELESYLSENFAWRYIRQTCDTADKALVDALQFFISEIQPHLAVYGNDLDKKAAESPFLS